MKRCPECRRDYYDDSLLYCLDDGIQLLEGPARLEPATEIISDAGTSGGIGASEAETKLQLNETHETAGITSEPKTVRRFDKRIVILFAILVIAVPTGIFGYRYFTSIGGRQIDSIAVLPFTNDSGNPDVEYLSDGMTETLISSLSQLPQRRFRQE